MKLNFQLFRMIAVFAALMSVQAIAAAEPSWPAVTKEMRPWAYNWWMGCAADRAGLELQAKQFAEAGMGGYHVIPIYEAKEEKHPKVAFLSEEWTRLFNTADETARAQGLGVDLSIGCGWCFGGLWVSKENGGWHLVRMRGDEKPKQAGARLLWEGKNEKGKRMSLYSVLTGLKVKSPPRIRSSLTEDNYPVTRHPFRTRKYSACLPVSSIGGNRNNL